MSVFGLLSITVAVMLMTPFALTALVSVATKVENGETLFLLSLAPSDLGSNVVPSDPGRQCYGRKCR